MVYITGNRSLNLHKEQRFQEGDTVRVTRILAADMGRHGDLKSSIFEEYVRDMLGEKGTISEVEHKYLEDDGYVFVYCVRTEDDEKELWFHQEELDFA